MLAIVASVVGGLVSHRVFKETDALLILSMAPLVGVFFVLIIGNWQWPSWPVFFGLLLLLLQGPKLKSPGLSRNQWLLLGLSAAVVTLFTCYHQVRFLDTDNWIHEPLIASYTLGILPPVNPFSPELAINGHYGRDLVMATMTPRGVDPLVTVWRVNPVIQLSAFLSFFGVIRVLTGSYWQGYLGSVMAFFGMNVGFRVGLLDSFDGNNGVVYALLAPLFFFMFKVLKTEKMTATAVLQWVFAGGFLGLYQLVYESHFGLMFLTGATVGVALCRRREPWIALLVVAAVALPLACVEGGVFTDLAGRAASDKHTAMEDHPLNPSQHVGLTFPKKNFLQVLTTKSEQQRVSVAYRTGLFSSFYRSPQEEGYMFIFDPRFVNAHWLPLYLAPLTFFWLWRRRHLIGLGFWSFGLWAFLIPGLVDFGPAYEYESFRWEFAAGLGFAVALGVSLASWLESRDKGRVLELEKSEHGWSLQIRKSFLPLAGSLLVLVGCLAAGEKLVNDMIIHLQKNPSTLFTSVEKWRTEQSSLGMTTADLEATKWMALKVEPMDRFLSNRIDDTTSSIWHDSVISARTGALPAGHAFSPLSEGFPAAPPYYGDALYRSFWSTGNKELLRLTPVRWLFVDLAKIRPEVLKSLEDEEQSPVFTDEEGHRRQVFRVAQQPPARATETPLEISVESWPEPTSMQVGQHYPIEVILKNNSTKAVEVGAVRARVDSRGEWPSTEVPLEVEPLQTPLQPGQEIRFPHSLVTPLDEGDYALELSLPSPTDEEAQKVEVPFVLDYLFRLKLIRPRVELPESLQTRGFYDIPLVLTSSTPFRTSPGAIFSYRLRRDTGEPVWELDRIPQMMEFELEPEKEWLTAFRFMTPTDPGDYVLQLFFKDPRTNRSFQIGSEKTIRIEPR